MRTLLFILLSFSFTATLLVPEEYLTIQSAINASNHADTVLVSSGIYYENINFNGMNISLIGEERETTIINGNQNGSVVVFDNGENSEAILSGFTITGGQAYDGGGIYCSSSSPTISNNIITNK